MNILVLTNVLPFHRRNGGEICSARLVGRLCEIARRVLVIGRGDSMGVPALPQLEARSVAPREIEFAGMSTGQKLLSLAGAVCSGEAWTTYRMSGGVTQALKRTIGKENFDYVFIDHLQIHAWYRALGLKAPPVLVTHNIEHQLYGDMLKRTSGKPSRWVLKREQALLRELDRTVLQDIGIIGCLTEADKAYYDNLAGELGIKATVDVLPGYSDAGAKAFRIQDGKPSSSGPWRIGILGTWTWESNRVGLQWFLREVLPHISEDCEVVVAGQGLNAEQLPARVCYLGFVESVEQFYQSVDLVAIPSVEGGGIQEKTIEALGYGIPIVATDVALRGIKSFPSHVRMVGEPREFAAACCERQASDPARIQAETLVWNSDRRLQYANAIDRMLAAASRRAGINVVQPSSKE